MARPTAPATRILRLVIIDRVIAQSPCLLRRGRVARDGASGWFRNSPQTQAVSRTFGEVLRQEAGQVGPAFGHDLMSRARCVGVKSFVPADANCAACKAMRD